ncbi:hypothetical protein N6H18_12865 [Reichenbachiella agarivorans]|uniref:Heavy-metal resistance n=1 Tax=Reichenbachiella agarivorans TaxID=2979464 RepID=A0ABY6CME1_9BACT|nr:hypothetical protein [Reichenbachiella agarivorans]UXP31240.1 hypothetical protein N6H18_12865 [Reichenbachiella agarivorans]
MNSNTIFKVGLGCMMILNGILIYLLIQNHPPHKPRPNGQVLIQISEQLQLSPQQKEAYERSAQSHDQSMRQINNKQKEILKLYFSTLKTNNHTKDNHEDLILQIQSLESEKTIATYQHFEELKNICNESQLSSFDQVVDQLISLLLHKEKNNHPPPRGH